MKLKIKKLSDNVQTPHYSSELAAGMDLYAHTVKYVYDEDIKDQFAQYSLSSLKYLEYGTGLAVEIPKGFVGLIFPRSSVTNKDLFLGNAVGIIDADYRGEIKFRFKPTRISTNDYKLGEKIGQMILMPFPKVELEEVRELTDTIRGTGGYGSTDK